MQLVHEPLGAVRRDAEPRVETQSAPLWAFSRSFTARELHTVDPLAACDDVLCEAPLRECDLADVRVVLAELIANALEHGLLRLDSSLKSTTDGFERYYAERERRLACLDAGWLSIRLELGAHGDELALEVADSGQGFRRNVHGAADSRPFGRGLALVESLCSELEHREGGRVARATCTLRSGVAA